MGDAKERLMQAAGEMPLVAVLRGLSPERAAGTARALVAAGFRILEVPLNGEGALRAISEVRAAVGRDVVVGAGTVLKRSDVRATQSAGGELIVAPNFDNGVMDEGRLLGMALMPGVMTPSEAFAALGAGAHILKLFPAEVVGVAGLKALRAVLRRNEGLIYPVGGVSPDTMRTWHDAGADGFGMGTSLFKPEYGDEDVANRARSFVAAWRAIRGRAT